MNEVNLAKQLLLSSNYWVMNKTLVYEIGIEAAFLLTCMAEAEKMMGDEEGWFYQTIGTLEKHSTLTRHKQGIAIDVLIEKGILKQRNKGMPMKRYFKIDYHKLSETLINASMRKIDNQGCEKPASKDEENQQPSLKEIDKLVCEKSATSKESINKENNNKESKYKEKEKQQSCKPSSQYKFEEGSIELNLAREMRRIMLEVKPDGIVPGDKVKDLQNWSQHIDYMLRLDNRDPMKLIEIFKWTQKNDFWVANIRSPRKLRDKWDSLELQMDRDRPKNTNNNLKNLAQQYERAVEEEEGGLFG